MKENKTRLKGNWKIKEENKQNPDRQVAHLPFFLSFISITQKTPTKQFELLKKQNKKHGENSER